MHRSHLRHVISTLVILLAVLACALPGQTIQPAPTKDLNAISTSVAGTAQAAEQQTEQANLYPSTATVIPTDTTTPTPKISSVGTSLLTLADGSTQFTDHVAGIQIFFSSIWLVFRLGQSEYYAAWEKPETQNPEFLDIFGALQNDDPYLFRVHALDVRPGYMSNGMPTLISVIFHSGDTRSLGDLEKIERNQHPPCDGFKFISASYPQTNNGTQVLVVEKSCNAAENGGFIYYKYVFFVLPSGTLHVDLQTHSDFKDEMLLEFDQVVNSLTPVIP